MRWALVWRWGSVSVWASDGLWSVSPTPNCGCASGVGVVDASTLAAVVRTGVARVASGEGERNTKNHASNSATTPTSAPSAIAWPVPPPAVAGLRSWVPFAGFDPRRGSVGDAGCAGAAGAGSAAHDGVNGAVAAPVGSSGGEGGRPGVSGVPGVAGWAVAPPDGVPGPGWWFASPSYRRPASVSLCGSNSQPVSSSPSGRSVATSPPSLRRSREPMSHGSHPSRTSPRLGRAS